MCTSYSHLSTCLASAELENERAQCPLPLNLWLLTCHFELAFCGQSAPGRSPNRPFQQDLQTGAPRSRERLSTDPSVGLDPNHIVSDPAHVGADPIRRPSSTSFPGSALVSSNARSRSVRRMQSRPHCVMSGASLRKRASWPRQLSRWGKNMALRTIEPWVDRFAAG